MCERREEDALGSHDEMVNELNENDDGSNRVGAARAARREKEEGRVAAEKALAKEECCRSSTAWAKRE